MKKTIKKLVAAATIATMAFGFGAGVQTSLSNTKENPVAVAKEDIIQYRPGVI
ncbi:hypothetical protein [Priestia megaterium]|uniref:hypothetical protein n=1 Tax=Priestia megaterium TaxID=1404 RepID=UPI002E1ADB55|nr:hypothetical protein [Priestia megaterium]